jgi:hypothetical protein
MPKLCLPRECDVYTTSGRANLERTVHSGSNIALPALAVITCVSR